MLSENNATNPEQKPEFEIDAEETPSRMSKPAKLQLKEIRIALGDSYKPIMNLKEEAAVSRLAPNTLKKKVSQGQFRQSAKRGRPLLFWTDRFLQELMK